MSFTLRYSTTTNTIHAARDNSRDAWCGARVGAQAGGSSLWSGKFCKRCRIDLTIVRGIVQAFLVFHRGDDDTRDRERIAAVLASARRG